VSGIWAIVPVKEFEGAKQRLSPVLSPGERRALAAIMLEDGLEALSAVRELAGLIVVTLDPAATLLATRYGARVVTEGAREGHTGAVTAAARLLIREGGSGMMTMPGDVPRATSAEIAATVAAHRAAPSFTIVPAHDDLGSNTIVMSPPDAVPLRFGEDSFFPHLDAARARGIDPLIVRQSGIGMDIDNPADLVTFLKMSPPPAPTRTLAFLEQSGAAARLLAMGQERAMKPAIPGESCEGR
jgi:2-phospho-L-lactate guanylyltransferase